jgi:3-oxoacyl-[acyl-carrier protein] reductase
LPPHPSRSYLVIGASGTIGSAVASRLAARGVNLGLHYRSNARAAGRLRARLERAGSHCVCLQSDLASEQACEDVVRRFHARFGALTGLALCGGTVPWQPWRSLDARAWQRALFEHCVAPFVLSRAAIALMDRRSGGRIVFLSSIAPKYGGSPKTLHYAAAKAALEAAMRGLARETARSGILVNGVRAGFVATPQQRRGRSRSELRERISKIPLGRAGLPGEIAGAFQYLFSEDAAFITGELLAVAGGD